MISCALCEKDCSFHNEREQAGQTIRDCIFFKKKDEQMNDTESKIVAMCDTIKSVLVSKNRKYGDSALNPIRIFSKSDAKEQLRVRIDDKLNRIINRKADEDEDAVLDLIGYLILYKIAE